MRLTQGANTSVPLGRLTVQLNWSGSGGPDLDVSALLLSSGRVRGDADFVFYNQPHHLSGAVSHAGKRAGADTIAIDLSAVEAAVERIVIAVSSDGGTFGQVRGLRVTVAELSGTEIASFDIAGTTETAMIAGELYRRGTEWKFRAVGQGYDAGLAGLATDFGISVDDDPGPPTAVSSAPVPPLVPPPQVPSAPVPPLVPSAPVPVLVPQPTAAPAPQVSLKKQKLLSLEKDLAHRAPGLLSLTKTAAVSLEKRGLGEHTARVALCLDISGSMAALYRSGKIQALVERVLAVGVRFDDDGQVDCFLFGKHVHQPGPIGIDNVHSYTTDMLRRHSLEPATNYGLAMQRVREHYFGSSELRFAPFGQPLPVYVMFVTDGQTMDEARTRDQVIASSFEPLFWQFMAIGRSPDAVDVRHTGGRRGLRAARGGGSDFAFLEELDDMGGRFLDNADFFAVTDPANLADEQLFDLMATEYPGWLAQARARGLTR